ncbi:B-cell antigen receptor complex-associated protein alpha chain [Phasianus colchicus]|uniref:B-cell antigen receptor complex-associated protein alpha chain n=1 Tax=Phasianus colchicus TaxID=9054 RepID=UPI00129EDA1D|nr:B-cell antigen receptor complex-associated protein alpha chain [Phasianus colchicus]
MPGKHVTLRCPHGRPGANVTWFRLACPRPGCSVTPIEGTEREGTEMAANGTELVLNGTGRNWAGIFYCRVRDGTAEGASCGTFVRVRESEPAPFLALSEGTKNRLMVAEGALLLLCAAGPGMLLLLRKRWANERLLQGKKSLGEEENLYEGLDLTQCSMYEDISHRPQPTYQDVGTAGGGGAGLEKP